jgi:hypothetical protein
MTTPQTPEPPAGRTSTAYGADTEHDRRVRARLAELAAAHGMTAQDVLAQVDRAIRTGGPLPVHDPAPNPTPDTDTYPPARVLQVRPADDDRGRLGLQHRELLARRGRSSSRS